MTLTCGLDTCQCWLCTVCEYNYMTLTLSDLNFAYSGLRYLNFAYSGLRYLNFAYSGLRYLYFGYQLITVLFSPSSILSLSSSFSFFIVGPVPSYLRLHIIIILFHPHSHSFQYTCTLLFCNQRPLLFPWARNCTLITQYRFTPDTDSIVVSQQSKIH